MADTLPERLRELAERLKAADFTERADANFQQGGGLYKQAAEIALETATALEKLERERDEATGKTKECCCQYETCAHACVPRADHWRALLLATKHQFTAARRETWAEAVRVLEKAEGEDLDGELACKQAAAHLRVRGPE